MFLAQAPNFNHKIYSPYTLFVRISEDNAVCARKRQLSSFHYTCLFMSHYYRVGLVNSILFFCKFFQETIRIDTTFASLSIRRAISFDVLKSVLNKTPIFRAHMDQPEQNY